MEYTKAVASPPLFAGLTSLPTLFGTTCITNMTQLSVDLRNQQVVGQRQFWAVNTFVSTEAMLNATYFRFNDSITTFQSVANITLGYTLEPLPPALYARHADDNPFGLDDRNQSLVVGLLTASWTDPEDDLKVDKAGRALTKTIEKDGQSLGAYDPFLYFNYAAPWQDPITSYGRRSVIRMRKIAEEVDPHQVFIRQVPGGFKINR
ncbi:hypothetical protein GGR54DRAFT_611285 [Hypoxylon sp. NC1633]|nr:hypothetical protein GGR54DRAFT_611285 [Hypoxylon sp. NC1633]